MQLSIGDASIPSLDEVEGLGGALANHLLPQARTRPSPLGAPHPSAAARRVPG